MVVSTTKDFTVTMFTMVDSNIAIIVGMESYDRRKWECPNDSGMIDDMHNDVLSYFGFRLPGNDEVECLSRKESVIRDRIDKIFAMIRIAA